MRNDYDLLFQVKEDLSEDQHEMEYKHKFHSCTNTTLFPRTEGTEDTNYDWNIQLNLLERIGQI